MDPNTEYEVLDASQMQFENIDWSEYEDEYLDVTVDDYDVCESCT